MRKLWNAFITNYRKRERVLSERGILFYLGLHRSGGYVLIIVLIITTLLIAIAGEFIVMAQTNIGYGQKLKNRLKASYLAKSGIQLAQFILYADMKGVTAESITGRPTDKEIDSYNDIWALDYPPIPLGDGTLKIAISDENSKINLSVLANEFTEKTKYYFFTQNFMMNMGFSPDLADIIHDWVDVDDSRMPYGAESGDYYQSRPVPYHAKNAAMDSIDELLLLKDITPEIFYGTGGGNFESEKREQNLVEHNKGNVSLNLDTIKEIAGDTVTPNTREINRELPAIGKERSRKLADYFTVYGDRQDYTSDFNKININTASFRVLSALTDKMTPDIVTELIRRRLVQPFRSVDEVKDLIDDQTVRDRLTVRSYVFKIVSTASIEGARVQVIIYYNRNLRTVYYWCEE